MEHTNSDLGGCDLGTFLTCFPSYAKLYKLYPFHDFPFSCYPFLATLFLQSFYRCSTAALTPGTSVSVNMFRLFNIFLNSVVHVAT